MAFERLNFTKTWLSPVDFPTEEANESRVRSDLQLLHDEGKNGLNRLMDALEAPACGENLGAVDETGKAVTVQSLLTRLTALLTGIGRVENTLGQEDTALPTSGAVYRALRVVDGLDSRLTTLENSDFATLTVMEVAQAVLAVLPEAEEVGF